MKIYHINIVIILFKDCYCGFVSGVRFRRQHWCLLSILLLIIVLGIAIGIHVNSSQPAEEGDAGEGIKPDGAIQVTIPTTEEGRVRAVQQMLKEVPLIDG